MGSSLDKELGCHPKSGKCPNLPDFNPCEPCPTRNQEKGGHRRVEHVLVFEDGSSESVNGHRKASNRHSFMECNPMSPNAKFENMEDVHHTSYEHHISDWSESDSHMLENAVRAVANKYRVHVPRYRELSACYQDGNFVTEEDEDFWLDVAHREGQHPARECYLRYNELHGSDVARFHAPRLGEAGHSHGERSAHEATLIAGREAHPESRMPRRHASHFL